MRACVRAFRQRGRVSANDEIPCAYHSKVPAACRVSAVMFLVRSVGVRDDYRRASVEGKREVAAADRCMLMCARVGVTIRTTRPLKCQKKNGTSRGSRPRALAPRQRCVAPANLEVERGQDKPSTKESKTQAKQRWMYLVGEGDVTEALGPALRVAEHPSPSNLCQAGPAETKTGGKNKKITECTERDGGTEGGLRIGA